MTQVSRFIKGLRRYEREGCDRDPVFRFITRSLSQPLVTQFEKGFESACRNTSKLTPRLQEPRYAWSILLHAKPGGWPS